MMPNHHPTSDELLAYVVGDSELWLSVLIATHLTLCPQCREQVDELEAIGALLLERMPHDGLAVDEPMRSPGSGPGPARPPAIVRSVPAEIAGQVPRPLHPFLLDKTPRFRFLAPGLQHIPLGLSSGERPLRLVRFKPGFVVPEHAHGGLEWLLILRGELTDGRTGERYGRGDVSRRDAGDVHTQRIGEAEPCVAVFAHEGPPIPTTLMGKVLSRIVGL